MTRSERIDTMRRCLEPPTWYVVKLFGTWYVKSRETQQLFPHGPAFKRKRDAVRYADDNASAVYKRLLEENNR